MVSLSLFFSSLSLYTYTNAIIEKNREAKEKYFWKENGSKKTCRHHILNQKFKVVFLYGIWTHKNDQWKNGNCRYNLKCIKML